MFMVFFSNGLRRKNACLRVSACVSVYSFSTQKGYPPLVDHKMVDENGDEGCFSLFLFCFSGCKQLD